MSASRSNEIRPRSPHLARSHVHVPAEKRKKHVRTSGRRRLPRDSGKSIRGVRVVLARRARAPTGSPDSAVFAEFAYINTQRAMFINQMNSVITSTELSSAARSTYRCVCVCVAFGPFQFLNKYSLVNLLQPHLWGGFPLGECVTRQQISWPICNAANTIRIIYY